MLSDFRADVTATQAGFECGGADSTDYVMLIDVLRARIDFNGDGKTEPEETPAVVLAPLLSGGYLDDYEHVPTGKTKRKGLSALDDTIRPGAGL
ncbi:MAG: hypothetical protein MO846_01500 [Candidatus Devosia symbiotica]|nr:hypothetical protein [Candidatus Devosia symbiotica]